MKDYNAICIVPFLALEPGDVFAYEFLGGVVSGIVSMVAYWPESLGEKERAYMVAEGLDIPTGKYEPLGGQTQCLVFGSFVDSNVRLRGSGRQFGHMFVDQNTRVAVFPHGAESNRRDRERRARYELERETLEMVEGEINNA